MTNMSSCLVRVFMRHSMSYQCELRCYLSSRSLEPLVSKHNRKKNMKKNIKYQTMRLVQTRQVQMLLPNQQDQHRSHSTTCGSLLSFCLSRLLGATLWSDLVTLMYVKEEDMRNRVSLPKQDHKKRYDQTW